MSYNVTVSASDGMASSSQSFTWTVRTVGLPNPGSQSNLDGDVVSLQLTGSDAAGRTLTYSATGLPPGLSIAGTTGLISGTIANTANNTTPYAVTVTATDGTNSASQSFNWSVAKLALNAPGNQENREGTAVSLQLSAIDSGGTPSYSATGLPSGLSISSGGLITGTLGTAAHGSSPYPVTATATDGGNTSSQSFVWTVTPRVALVNPGNQGNASGDSVSLQLSATSPGGAMSYSASGLPPGLNINGSGLISGTPTTASTTPYSVTVTANDGTSSSSQTFQWTVSIISLASPGDQTNLDNDSVSLSLSTHYHGMGTLSYSATGLPTGLSLSSATGQITGTINNTADTNSPYSVTVTATDGTNTSSQTFNWTINPRVSITSLGNPSNAVGDVVSLQVSASDANNATLSYSATGLPSGLTISNTTGLIGGTIATGADTSSPYTVMLTVSDGAGSATKTFIWTVAHVSLTNPGPQASVDGKSVSLQVQGKDADSDALTWTASGLPSGLSIGSSSGLISGTLATNADTNSPYNVTVAASDGVHSTSQTFLWTVGQVAVSNPGSLTNTEGDSVALQLQGLSNGGTLTYSASGLPNGLTLNASSGLISGTIAPGAAANGPFTVDAAVSNGTVSSSQSFTWTINPVVTLTAPADQASMEGNTVSLSVSASDSKHVSLTYSASGLPSGLSISSTTGLISGAISTGDSASSPYAVTVTASDGTYSSSATFNWTVTHTDTTALTMTNPGSQTNVASDSVTLPIHASDPDGKDALTYSATGLPDGLDIGPFSGIISGTLADDAASTASYAVTVTADDGNGQTVTQSFSWLVNAPVITAHASPVSAIEGNDTGSITVATFTTPDLNSQAGDFTVTINWGDGTAPDMAAVVTGGNGSFTVTDNHTSAEKGTYPISVQISNSITGGSATTSTTATVTDAALTLTGGFELGDAMDNPPGSFTLATFTDANPSASPTDYLVSIDWGDGSPLDTGNYAGSMGYGVYSIMARHTYVLPTGMTGPLTFGVAVTLTDTDGAVANTSSTVVVGQLVAQVKETMGSWVFEDANTYSTPSDFVSGGQPGVAAINWGDNSSSLGTLSAVPSGGSAPVDYLMVGDHTYADSLDQPGGVFPIGVTATDVDGASLSGTQYVSVVRPQLSLSVANLDIASSLSVSNVQVAAFTDPAPGDLASEFTAQIDWGDGSSGVGTIQEVTPGMFQVMGSHTYATHDWYTIKVTISQGWGGQAADVRAPGEVADKPIVKIVNGAHPGLDTLSVAKWEKAFERLNPGVRPPNIRVLGNFVNNDVDRFYVSVYDPTADKNPAVRDTLRVHLSTSSDAGSDIVLQETGNDTKRFFSDNLLLTSVDVDKAEAGTSGFFVKLGDTVRATYDGQKATATVPVKKVVELHINILRNKDLADGGTPVISRLTVLGYVHWANVMYAQAGIRFQVEGPINIVDPPPGVNLSNGLVVRQGEDFTNGEKYLLGYDNYRTPTNNDIEVYYVNKMVYPSGEAGPLGRSYWAALFGGGLMTYYADSLIVTDESAKISENGGQTLAHEIGHILMNPGTHPDGYVGVNQVNLMASPGYQVVGQVTDSRRITDAQATDMLNNRKNLLWNP